MIDVLFINGLSCGDGTQDRFVAELKLHLGAGFKIHRPDLKRLDRTSTRAAVEGIRAQFEHLKNPIVIGFSLGGLWAIFLARIGFTNRVVCISPNIPSNWVQIDLLRLRIFGGSLFFGRPFKFNHDIAHKHLMANVPEEIVRESSEHFMKEPASLIRDYGLMRAYTKLSRDDVSALKSNVQGLIITGTQDRMTQAHKQSELAALIGFKQVTVACGHTPQFGPHKDIVHRSMAEFIGPSNVAYPEFGYKRVS